MIPIVIRLVEKYYAFQLGEAFSQGIISINMVEVKPGKYIWEFITGKDGFAVGEAKTFDEVSKMILENGQVLLESFSDSKDDKKAEIILKLHDLNDIALNMFQTGFGQLQTFAGVDSNARMGSMMPTNDKLGNLMDNIEGTKKTLEQLDRTLQNILSHPSSHSPENLKRLYYSKKTDFDTKIRNGYDTVARAEVAFNNEIDSMSSKVNIIIKTLSGYRDDGVIYDLPGDGKIERVNGTDVAIRTTQLTSGISGTTKSYTQSLASYEEIKTKFDVSKEQFKRNYTDSLKDIFDNYQVKLDDLRKLAGTAIEAQEKLAASNKEKDEKREYEQDSSIRSADEVDARTVDDENKRIETLPELSPGYRYDHNATIWYYKVNGVWKQVDGEAHQKLETIRLKAIGKDREATAPGSAASISNEININFLPETVRDAKAWITLYRHKQTVEKGNKDPIETKYDNIPYSVRIIPMKIKNMTDVYNNLVRDYQSKKAQVMYKILYRRFVARIGKKVVSKIKRTFTPWKTDDGVPGSIGNVYADIILSDKGMVDASSFSKNNKTAKNFVYATSFLILDSSDVAGVDLLNNPAHMRKLIRLGWTSFVIMDSPNEQVIFCSYIEGGHCQTIPYAQAFASAGKNLGKFYETMDELRTQTRPFRRKKAVPIRRVGMHFKRQKAVESTVNEKLERYNIDEGDCTGNLDK